jgi:carbon monoxide dehydrogenase subunit G
MSIRFEHSIDVACPQERAFALLDDVSSTPKWLARCTGIEKLTPGANAVGTKLRYAYKDSGRAGTMDGEVTARAPGERLTFRYDDAMMGVIIDFRMEAAGSGTRLTHAIDITPKTFVAKLFSPIIRRQLPKQTVDAMAALRRLLEAR